MAFRVEVEQIILAKITPTYVLYQTGECYKEGVRTGSNILSEQSRDILTAHLILFVLDTSVCIDQIWPQKSLLLDGVDDH